MDACVQYVHTYMHTHTHIYIHTRILTPTRNHLQDGCVFAIGDCCENELSPLPQTAQVRVEALWPTQARLF